MKAVFTVEVPDDFLEQRAREMADRNERPAESGPDYFHGRCQDVAEDELALAFYAWPVEITLAVEP